MESEVPKATHLSNWKRHEGRTGGRVAARPEMARRERTHNKFPRAPPQLPGKRREMGERGGLGSRTSRPQHLYHKSPQSSHGSFQSLGVSAMEKSHGLSARAGLSYFTRDSTSLPPSHSKLKLAFEDNIFKISLALSLSFLAERLFLNMLLPRSLTAWGIKVRLSCSTRCGTVHFSVNNNLESLWFGMAL